MHYRLPICLVVAATYIALFCLPNDPVQYKLTVFPAEQNDPAIFLPAGDRDQFHSISVCPQQWQHASAGDRKLGSAAVFQLQPDHLKQFLHWNGTDIFAHFILPFHQCPANITIWKVRRAVIFSFPGSHRWGSVC